MESKLSFRIFTLIILLMGVILLIAGIVSERRQRQVKSWAKTKGKIIRSHFVDDSEGGIFRVEYEYVVDNQYFHSTRLAPFFMLYNASEMAKKYPVDAVVTVYYNPHRPAEAVLEVRSPMTWVLIVGGAVCIGIAAFLLFVVK